MASEQSELTQIVDLAPKYVSESYRIWHAFSKHKPAVTSAVVLLMIILAVLLAPVIAPYKFDAIDLRHTKQPPTLLHLMGTDDLGRDLFTRILFGGRISMSIGVFAALVGTILGAIIGASAGYYGGSVDNILMRFTDVAFSIPSLPLLIILGSFTKSAVPAMILIIGLLSWMPTARVVRSAVLILRDQEYVIAAHMLGASDFRIVFRHILLNTIGPIIVGATLGVGSAIITESSLSFLGLGVSPPTPTWGNMLQAAQATMATKPWLTIFPGMMILIVVLCINFLGDGILDSFDPTLRS